MYGTHWTIISRPLIWAVGVPPSGSLGRGQPWVNGAMDTQVPGSDIITSLCGYSLSLRLLSNMLLIIVSTSTMETNINID